MFHKSPAAIEDSAVLSGVLGCQPLRRINQVRFGSNPAVSRDGYQMARQSNSRSLRSAQTRKRPVPSLLENGGKWARFRGGLWDSEEGSPSLEVLG